MSKTWSWGLSITFIIILAIVAALYAAFYGTPWGRANAERQLMNSLRQEYPDVKFHQVIPANYDFIWSYYQVGITYDKIPNVIYSFSMKNGKAVCEGTSGNYEGHSPPMPVPYSTSWVPDGITSAR